MDVSKMPRYVGPVNPSMYPSLTIGLCGLGALFMAWFFVYEVTSNKFTRSLAKEIVVATLAAAFLGVGSVFLLLWVGIYV
ncbi:hypothetical protein PMAYCL1PPCAC_28317 [Pristionchus mayeri]|uniref:Dolichyl-diphosphooligosaccharide-protein glycosyltransferase subunit TMEM258 n=1 Tax=Pristionchus mayeri TaxID=1317129 RepID=A0AAN5I9W6_9BILA|nr:hypothetical protein PMAYCL1PPCAC_28317 [Pristionchus mayeri]